MTITKIAFVGAGSIAEAIIAGLLESRFLQAKQITVSNRSNMDRLFYLQQTYNVTVTQNKQELIEGADLIFFVMKPKDVVEAVSSVKEYITEQQLVVSLMAGVSTSSITGLLQKNTPIIRAMPNTSAAILKSATAISPSIYAKKHHVELVKKVFETVGLVTVVDEEQMHAVTGLSGSGPAYIYYVVEAMEQAAREIGLDEKTGKALILQTMIGAAEMLKSTTKHPSALRKEITSPGGTTQAGIETLQSYEFQQALIQCIVKATERSRELGQTLTNLVKHRK
ncbi:pyrroline-5-carboxylate reductase ProI [Bacillus sp. 165]|uniref:pyrroline-5-carboxylate reductase ProI n=1 Tax=Bacillus sp. 165 TaxID=1529117 RepID=UPI001ADB3D00|nr:pyrroline-5-carboxylate reductase ProI [Bacillus sp. 165]MBO9129755.1 pyrroline-5-carboxylate reductase [Bacillus sp. 165]